ncbi:MAG: T9SS type A sorting domain-containing protein, partial [Prevotellaceae bacterium]|nr:T9SS type A sorting domain-containing protein [Prevotellaceae bacterium]
GFDATGHVVVTIGDESSTSVEAIDNTDDTWKYIGLAYDRNGKTVSVNAYQGTQTLRPFQSKAFTNAPATQGKLYLGNNASGNSGFSGAAALLHFYSTARSEAQMTSTKSLTKSGTETGLIGLWELEADEGALGKDKARSRHLNLNNTSRYIYPIGKALALNGTDQYARITSGMYPFGVYDDFTLEFWFKGGEQDTATLLSVGVTTYVGFDVENRLVLTTGGSTQILASAGLLDDKWHHFALSVKRNGMARASIDGTVTASFNSAILGDIGGCFYHLGVKYVQINDYTYGYTEYFAGNIDELRVWNSALTADAILLNKNYSLRGDEAGLKAYYPFEKTQQVNGSVYSVGPLYTDVKDNTLTADRFGGADVSDVSAPLQLARTVKNVPFTFTASNNKIVLNLTEEEYRIEGVTLYITAVNVLDMHDNRSNSINWTAYVNRNALNWNTDLVEIIMEDGDVRTFKASISNSSGDKLDYFIEDLPSWLSVDAPQGSLNPLSAKELTFTVATGVNIGAYEASVVLTGTNNVKKILPVTLKVTGERPNWSVNPANFESSMTVVGQLLIENLPQEDPDDLLAAFIGNTCVGVTSPKFEKAYQTYLVYMQIWGNDLDNGANITFKIWDASTGNIYPTVATTTTAGDAIQLRYGNSLEGTPKYPIQFNATNAVEQALLFNTGWNWISFSVVSPNLADANDLMANINNGIEIKGQSVFSRYDADSLFWGNGTLDGLEFNNVEMYKLKTSGAGTISLPGSPVDVENTSITLVDGWNWIAYTPQVNETVSEAFAGANPEEGDVVKSQTAFSVYDNVIGNWVGTLEYLRPGQGYMYNTATARNFKYPKTGIMTRSSEGDPIEGEPLTLNRPQPSLNSEIAPNYESNLSLIGEVKLKSDILSETSRLIAYVGGEPRGIAEMKPVNDKRLFFLPVYSNSNSNETVIFVLENNGKEIPLREYITYKPNALLGTVNSPVLLTDANINLKVYPNPFLDRMTASFEIEQPNANVRVELISMDGKVIYSTKYTIAVTGPQLVDIDAATVGSLTPGTYIIRVTLNDNETFTNVIIKGVY